LLLHCCKSGYLFTISYNYYAYVVCDKPIHVWLWICHTCLAVEGLLIALLGVPGWGLCVIPIVGLKGILAHRFNCPQPALVCLGRGSWWPCQTTQQVKLPI